jgi:dTDP-4-dehydrorhamnose 3,5-epimerase
MDGLVRLVPEPHGDNRGFFIETYRQDELKDLGIDNTFVQDNHARSTRGTLRGLHFQLGEGQAKLVRVARGTILDVAVDIRPESATFGRHELVQLDDVEHHQLFVPVGFAHGYLVLSDVADVCYRVTSYYDPAAERGIAWDDPDLAIPWPLKEPLLSPRDRSQRRFSEVAETLAGQ